MGRIFGLAMDKEQVQFYAGLLGTLASVSALSYIAWQHRKNQALFAKQDELIQRHVAEAKMLNNVDGRLRNLELTQCSNPYVRQNAQLANILNCPPPQSGPVGPVGQMDRVQRPSSITMQQPPTQHQPVMPGGYVGRTNVAASQNLPPMPNYGFYGDGPAGTASGSMMMGALAPDPAGNFAPIPFEK